MALVQGTSLSLLLIEVGSSCESGTAFIAGFTPYGLMECLLTGMKAFRIWCGC